jgi:Arm DNA-binding domain
MLTDTACKNAHKHDKTKLNQPFKLSDSHGLYLYVKPLATSWSKLWRLKYRIGGIEKSLSLGKYPQITLCQVRVLRDDAR